MRLPRRFLELAAGAAMLLVLPGIAGAQDYAARPVRIVVGFAAGGPTDILARLIGQWLSARLNQQFIIEFFLMLAGIHHPGHDTAAIPFRLKLLPPRGR